MELNCDVDERLRRNRTENRLEHKPSKRDIKFSDQLLVNEDELYRMNSLEEELVERNVLKIDNTKKEASEVAEMIVSHFNLE